MLGSRKQPRWSTRSSASRVVAGLARDHERPDRLGTGQVQRGDGAAPGVGERLGERGVGEYGVGQAGE